MSNRMQHLIGAFLSGSSLGLSLFSIFNPGISIFAVCYSMFACGWTLNTAVDATIRHMRLKAVLAAVHEVLQIQDTEAAYEG